VWVEEPKQRGEARGLFGVGGAVRAERAALAEKIDNEAFIGRSFGIDIADGPEAVAHKDYCTIQGRRRTLRKNSQDVLAASIEMARSILLGSSADISRQPADNDQDMLAVLPRWVRTFLMLSHQRDVSSELRDAMQSR